LLTVTKRIFYYYFAITKRFNIRFDNKSFHEANLLSFFFISLLQAQFQVNGLVTAASNRKPLLASIITDNGLKTITDVD
jgi:hypothetical protein